MDIDKSSTALLALDFQHDIVSRDGKFGSHGLGEVVDAMGAIPSAARALGAAREAGLHVAHAGVSAADGQSLNMTAGLFAGIVGLGAVRPGSEGVEFVDEMAPRPDEYVAMKATVSALAGTGLDSHLRTSGIRHLVLVGVATNMVVEGTTRQAVDMGYQVTILGDGCASFSVELHGFALGVLENLATISTVDEFVSAVKDGFGH